MTSPSVTDSDRDLDPTQHNMPWSFALPEAIFASPLLSTFTPIAAGCTVGYLVNRNGTKPLYTSLKQPPLAPPPWLFAPAWTTLYALMGYAAYHATSATSLVFPLSTLTSASEARSTIQTLYTTQLLFNYAWMPLFFGLRKPLLAAVDMAALSVNVGVLMRIFWDADRTAFWCFVPYAAWLGFAAYLNVGVGWLNGWDLDGKGDKKVKGRKE
ncbi:TspO/MBR family-domain-containing protein [Aspergillus pseudodeflectus]|uniref:TspO/MBR family-domain-containing protein n=1 Tax=Aspergillus pseudodeflectus TaxID=176178 RepID=A0ABR4KTR1_9EURO